MLSVAKSFMVYNTADNLEIIYAQIENLSSLDIIDIANDVLNPNKLSTLIYK
jgi:hypothetical protein